MRPPPWIEAEQYRQNMQGYGGCYGDTFGVFLVPVSKLGTELRILATESCHAREDFGPEYAWDHVSVSTPRRPPSWAEMCFVKRLFWTDDETVMQLHVPASQHINCHPNTLHLWRPQLLIIPRPPSMMV